MYKVIATFRDKYTKEIYNPGDTFVSEQESRVQNLISRGFIVSVEPEQPGQPVKTENDEEKPTGVEVNKKKGKKAAE